MSGLGRTVTGSLRQPTGPPPAFRLRDESRRCYKELKRDDMRDREFVGLGNISLSEEVMKNGRVIGLASRCCSDKSRGLCLIMWSSLSVRLVVSTPRPLIIFLLPSYLKPRLSPVLHMACCLSPVWCVEKIDCSGGLKFTRLWKSTVDNELCPQSKRFLSCSLTSTN